MSRRVMASGVVVDGGSVQLSRRGRVDAEVLRKFGLHSRVAVTYERPTRTLRQNSRLWYINSKLGEQLGLSPEEVHELSKQELNLVHHTYIDKTTGAIVDVAFPGPTRTMPIDVMADYQDRLLRHWAERGYYVDVSEDNY